MGDHASFVVEGGGSYLDSRSRKGDIQGAGLTMNGTWNVIGKVVFVPYLISRTKGGLDNEMRFDEWH